MTALTAHRLTPNKSVIPATMPNRSARPTGYPKRLQPPLKARDRALFTVDEFTPDHGAARQIRCVEQMSQRTIAAVPRLTDLLEHDHLACKRDLVRGPD